MERIKNVVRISGSSVVCTKAANCPESRVLKTLEVKLYRRRQKRSHLMFPVMLQF
jgi:hypothetical protein